MGSPALGEGVAHRSYAIATRGKRQYVESVFARKVPRVFAQSVRVGDWLFIAGQDFVTSPIERCFPAICVSRPSNAYGSLNSS